MEKELAKNYDSYKKEYYKRRSKVPYPFEMQEPTFEKYLHYIITGDFGIFYPTTPNPYH